MSPLTSDHTVVVAGAGQAGSQTAASLREEGFTGRIVVVGDEPHPPYKRPPLSKGHITGAAKRENLWLRAETYYRDQDIELLLDERVHAIDRTGARVELGSGDTLGYDHLVLALGARNRALPLPGADLDGVIGLRTLTHADDIRDRIGRAGELVVLGGGFIGLEVASTAVRLGIRTVVIEIADRLMGRVLSSPVADFLLEAHRSRGMQVELSTAVAQIDGKGGIVTGVTTSDGRHLAADVVLVGIGAVPNVELAAASGLTVDNGIVVDTFLATTDPRISAVGDCVSFPNPFDGGRPVRLESVQNATAQARCLAARLAGRSEPYSAVPWFWSDQADLKLQIAGLTTAGCTTTLRGDPARGKFSVFCFDGAMLRSVESINRPADHMAARRLVGFGDRITPEQAADVERPLKEFLADPAVTSPR